MSPALAALVVALVVQAADESAPLQIHVDRVNHDAVVHSLELRVGERWRQWTIEIEEGTTPETVVVRLRDSADRIHTRELTLTSETNETRSRELASQLALLVDQLDAAEVPPADPASTPPPPPQSETSHGGWLGVGPRAALNPGSPIDPELGVSLAGGAWLVRDHLQPVAEILWSRSTQDGLRLDALRFGTGVLGGGTGPGGRIWGGAGALLRAQWARATSTITSSGWWASPAVVAALAYRGRIVVAGAWLGVDLSFPPLYAHDRTTAIRWSLVRPMAAVHVGIRLPPRPRAKKAP